MPNSPRLTMVAVPVACLCLTACSTVVTGTAQPIALTAPGVPAATCRLTGGDGLAVTVTTPATLRVPKSRKDIDVTCTAPGQQPASQTVKSTYSDWSIVEYPLGYPIDAATGAMWVYPKQVAIILHPAPQAAP